MIEIGGQLINVKNVSQAIKQEIFKLPLAKQKPSKIFVYITVDRDVSYSVLYEVKQELKDVGVRRIIYSVKKEIL